LLRLIESNLNQKGLIREGIKVFKGPLPSWVRPKRATKGCDWHAKQDTVR